VPVQGGLAPQLSRPNLPRKQASCALFRAKRQPLIGVRNGHDGG
jgi:hypothetical protein